MKDNPTRDPLPAPFPVGTRLRCIEGYDVHVPRVSPARDITSHPEDWARIFGRGIEVTIDRVEPGRRGTGRQLRYEDGPMCCMDGGEPILDETKDGYSVYHVVRGEGHAAKMSGRCIFPDSARKWQVLASERVVCAHCERTVSVNRDGTVRKHSRGGSECRGSGRPEAGFARAP